MYAKMKKLAGKYKIVRVLFTIMVAICVFLLLMEKYYTQWKEKREQSNVKGRTKGNVREWRVVIWKGVVITTALCIVVSRNLVSGMEKEREWVSDLENEVNENINDEEESETESLQEVVFNYIDGVGKELNQEDTESTEKEDTDEKTVTVVENGDYKMSIDVKNFTEYIYERNAAEVLCPVVLCNEGSETLTGITIETKYLQLNSYDDAMENVLQREVESIDKNTEEKDNGNLKQLILDGEQENTTTISEEVSEETSVQVTEADTVDVIEEISTEVAEEATECTEEATSETLNEVIENIDVTEKVDVELLEELERVTEEDAQGVIEDKLEKQKLEDLEFSLLPEEKVTLYLSLPEDCEKGEYGENIFINADQLKEKTGISIQAKVYADEGEPWETIPDENVPVVIFDTFTEQNEVPYILRFNVSETKDNDSGITDVKCYLNGKKLELEPEHCQTTFHDTYELACQEVYAVELEETGVNVLVVQAKDQAGNEMEQQIEIQTVHNQTYRVTMPRKMELTVDPNMVYGSTQIYNAKEFLISNESEEDVWIDIEQMLLDINHAIPDKKVKKNCKLWLSVEIDGKDIYTVPLQEETVNDMEPFIVKGNAGNSEDTHCAKLKITGTVQQGTYDDWNEGDVSIKSQIKVLPVVQK